MRYVGLIGVVVACGFAQKPPAFDAASVKPALDRAGSFPYRMGPGSLSMRASVKYFIEEAYEVRDYQITGEPSWAQSDWYAIQAKAAGEADEHEVRLMFRTLLADRFHLKLHRETRLMQGYVLSIDKGGPKLPAPRSDVTPGTKGVIQMGGGIWVRGAPISQLAYGLTLELGQPVVDETGITGNYDFRLRFDDTEAMGGKASPAASGSAFTAVREVGLRLEAKKVPIEMIVVDSVERPADN